MSLLARALPAPHVLAALHATLHAALHPHQCYRSTRGADRQGSHTLCARELHVHLRRCTSGAACATRCNALRPAAHACACHAPSGVHALSTPSRGAEQHGVVHTQVYAQLMRIPEGRALKDLFTAVCDGAAADVADARHIGVDAHAADDLAHAAAGVVQASDTVFLLVRNGCSRSVVVTVEHGVDLVVAVPLSAATRGAQVRARGSPTKIMHHTFNCTARGVRGRGGPDPRAVVTATAALASAAAERVVLCLQVLTVLAAALLMALLLNACGHARRCWCGAARRKVILVSCPAQDLAKALRSDGERDSALTEPLLAHALGGAGVCVAV